MNVVAFFHAKKAAVEYHLDILPGFYPSVYTATPWVFSRSRPDFCYPRNPRKLWV